MLEDKSSTDAPRKGLVTKNPILRLNEKFRKNLVSNLVSAIQVSIY